MNLYVNGQSQVPPGFRFHPTEEELLQYYLRKQVAQEAIDLDVIPYVDLNKLEPWDIQEKCKIGSTPQNEWYFFNQKDKKYPTGTRTNRATEAGFWKATGRDKVVHNNVGRIGMRKTLVFYIGRAPCGQKSDWIMYEYRLDDDTSNANACNSEEQKEEDGWVVCRLFKKKNLCKPQPNPKTSPSSSIDVWTQIQNSSNDGDLEQILRCIVKPNCKQESEASTISNFTDMNNKNMINVQSSINNGFANTPPFNDLECGLGFMGIESSSRDSFTDQPKDKLDQWLGLDQLLVASKFSGEILKTSGRPSLYDQCSEVYSSDIDEWSFV